ncbi:MAG: adenosine deaminase [Anaerolineales bacterium]|nr:adenosine deaminase [Anaerolineales bacterium]
MKNFDPKYNDIPKTEIHCHLEGAIRTQTIIDVAREYNISLPAYEVDELDKHVKVLDQMRDLQAVLEAFDIFQRSITSPAVFERIAWELFEDCAKQNIKLFEVRFSPDWAFHGHDLNWDACLEGLLRAQERAEKEFDMAIGIIAITSRSMGADSCVKTVDWAIRHRDHIQAVDLADGEMIYPMQDFIKPILKAKDAGLKVTIHSGEDTPASYVIETVENFKPDRIGHGIHSIEDMRAVDMLIERGVTLEVNPWSNYLTNSVPTIEAHPLKKLYDLGVRVTINSDDPEVLETNVNNEYRIAREVLGMSMEEVGECNRVAFEASFIDAAKKQRIWDKYFINSTPNSN